MSLTLSDEQRPPLDPDRLVFLGLLRFTLEKVAADALHHSRLSGVPLPRGFGAGIASAAHYLEVYEKMLEEKRR